MIVTIESWSFNHTCKKPTRGRRWKSNMLVKILSRPGHRNSERWIVGNCTCFSFLKMFHLPSERNCFKVQLPTINHWGSIEVNCLCSSSGSFWNCVKLHRHCYQIESKWINKTKQVMDCFLSFLKQQMYIFCSFSVSYMTVNEDYLDFFQLIRSPIIYHTSVDTRGSCLRYVALRRCSRSTSQVRQNHVCSSSSLFLLAAHKTAVCRCSTYLACKGKLASYYRL